MLGFKEIQIQHQSDHYFVLPGAEFQGLEAFSAQSRTVLDKQGKLVTLHMHTSSCTYELSVTRCYGFNLKYIGRTKTGDYSCSQSQ